MVNFHPKIGEISRIPIFLLIFTRTVARVTHGLFKVLFVLFLVSVFYFLFLEITIKLSHYFHYVSCFQIFV